jgi:AAA+ ATPase superfamily predicted ATPase
MSERLIGRLDEIKLLSEALQSKEAELIALYGRRRVGKTFLIQHVVKSNLVFECSGIGIPMASYPSFGVPSGV